VHDVSAHLISDQEQAPITSSTFDLDGFVYCVHPELWEAISRLTLSKRDKRGCKQSDSHAYERKVRIAYIMCVVMFCATGDHCSVPLHTLLTDYIEASGGSSDLISVLNRLGAVASSNTLDRHNVQVSSQCKLGGLLQDLDCSNLTIATTDNIDFLQSHASVYAGNQYRSWHGTSVEVVQPQQRLKTTSAQPEGRVATCSMEVSPR